MSIDFSELDLQLALFDFYDTEDERESNVIAGVAIRHEDASAFAADVERLAVEKYGGATFCGLLEEDLEDESMAAAQQYKDAQRSAEVVAGAERAMAAGMPRISAKRPEPSIEGKSFEQIEREYAEARNKWTEFQADPNSFDASEARARLMDLAQAGQRADMAIQRAYESLEPHAQSELLKLLAADERISASYWFDVLFDKWPRQGEQT